MSEPDVIDFTINFEVGTVLDSHLADIDGIARAVIGEACKGVSSGDAFTQDDPPVRFSQLRIHVDKAVNTDILLYDSVQEAISQIKQFYQ